MRHLPEAHFTEGHTESREGKPLPRSGVSAAASTRQLDSGFGRQWGVILRPDALEPHYLTPHYFPLCLSSLLCKVGCHLHARMSYGVTEEVHVRP